MWQTKYASAWASVVCAINPCFEQYLALDFRAKVAVITVFSHIRFMGIIILCSLQMRVLLGNSIFLLHKHIRITYIIRDAGVIRGRVFYEEIRYVALGSTLTGYSSFFWIISL